MHCLLLDEENQVQGTRDLLTSLPQALPLPCISSLLPDSEELEIIDDWLEGKHVTQAQPKNGGGKLKKRTRRIVMSYRNWQISGSNPLTQENSKFTPKYIGVNILNA